MRKSSTAVFLGWLLVLAFFYAPHQLFARMTSNSFIVEDEGLTIGGGSTTSTTYTVEGDLGDPALTGTVSVPTVPAAGGSAPPAPPPPPPEQQPVDNAAPVISGIIAREITTNSAHIVWTTNESATSEVSYGITQSYELGTISAAPLVTSHDLGITSLEPATTYHFQVRSSDAAGNRAVSTDQTFQTAAARDNAPPIISDAHIENITDHSARVSWATDELSTSIVDLGVTPAYEFGPVEDGELTRIHHVDLARLVSETSYFVRVRSRDDQGNQGVSDGLAFNTLPDSLPPANIGNFRAAPENASLRLRWNNPPDPDFVSIIIMRRADRYPENAADGVRVYRGGAQTVLDSGLEPDRDFFYAAFSRDAAGNQSSGALARGHTNPAGTPEQPETPTPESEVLPVSPPGEPAVPVPAPTVVGSERVAVGVARFFLSSRALPAAFVGDRIYALPRATVSVVVPFVNLPKRAARVVLNVGKHSYQLSRNELQQFFEADVSAPEATGAVPSALIFTYEDGSEDAVAFSLYVEALGIVVEEINGVRVPVSGATVTLLSGEGGTLLPWNGERYRASNPIGTSGNGAFGFLVPPGTYAVRVEKDGYLTAQSARFQTVGNVARNVIVLVAIPVSPRKVIKPEAPPLENAIRVFEAIGKEVRFITRAAPQVIRRVADNPKVEKAAESVAAPLAITAGAAVATASATAAAPLFSLGTLLRGLITQPLLLLGRRKRKRWGVVYHAFLKLPIDLAIVRLVDAALGRVVQSRVTDREGRFAFIVAPGRYRIEVSKPGFTFPSEALKGKREDIDFADLYHGEEVEAKEAGTSLTPNVPLDPIEKSETPREIIRKKALGVLRFAASVSAVVISGISLAITPGALTGIMFVIQILLFEFFRRVARGAKPKGWGIIYDAATSRPLRHAFARIFDTQFNKLLDTKVTDASGRYAFLVGRNNFRITVDHEGYAPHEFTIDATKEAQTIITERVQLKPGTAPPAPQGLPPASPLPIPQLPPSEPAPQPLQTPPSPEPTTATQSAETPLTQPPPPPPSEQPPPA